MHGVVRRYEFDPVHSETVDREVNQTLVPTLVKVEGLVAYYWLDSRNGRGASVSIYEDEAGALESNRLLDSFVKKHLPMISAPEVTIGEVKARIPEPCSED